MSRASIEKRRKPASAYGGDLVELLVPASEHAALMDEASGLASLQLSTANTAWLRLLTTGALSPLDRFMGSADYEGVRKSMRLANGALFPWPITLEVKDGSAWQEGARIALRDTRNHLLAILTIEEVFERKNASRSFALSGPLQALSIPEPMLFPKLHGTPADVRAMLEQMDRTQVVAVDLWDSSDAIQSDVMRRTFEGLDAAMLMNLPVEEERIDDFDLYTRLRGWSRGFPGAFGQAAVLNFLNLPQRKGRKGHEARQLLLRAILHKNYGAHGYMFDAAAAESSADSAAISRGSLLELFAEIGIEAISPEGLSFSPERGAAMRAGEDWKAGFCVWFTGLPGAGKSTIAERLTVSLMDHGRRVTLLDGDVMRTHLSRGLSFSREDRDTNVQRIGFVAAEIVRHGGVAICAAVSPYGSAREAVRGMMPPGAFVEVFVDTPVGVCEQRDVKGFYAKARRGQMKSFTGVDDPYERPENPEVRIVTCDTTPEEGERQILDFLRLAHLRAGA